MSTGAFQHQTYASNSPHRLSEIAHHFLDMEKKQHNKILLLEENVTELLAFVVIINNKLLGFRKSGIQILSQGEIG